MPATAFVNGYRGFLPKPELASLIRELQVEGYSVLAPRLEEGVVSLGPIVSADEVAKGVTDEQAAGQYRTRTTDPEAYFQYGPGPDGPKRYLFPPTHRLFSLRVEDNRFVFEEGPPQAPKLAFLGIRPCEVAAMEKQDLAFGAKDRGHFRCELDSYYRQAREMALVIVVNCTRPSGSCFCASMGTGPKASHGFDLAMTEMRAGFLLEVGSPRGLELLQKLPVREPTPSEIELAELRLDQAGHNMGKELEVAGVREILAADIEHPAWEEFAKKCLGCGNCTMVCPTCFCSTVYDSNDLTGKRTTRTRQWESCYTHQFSYTTSGPERSTIKARHRHWVRHKFCTWYDQFGTSGCVGCGRCITWCPAGIDIVEEIKLMQESAKAQSGTHLAQGVMR